MHTPLHPPPPPIHKQRRRKSLLLSLLGFGFAAAVVTFLAASAVAGYMLWQVSKDLPDYESLAKYEPPVMTRIHANNGALIAGYARERRIFVPINAIPQRVIAAFLSAEDSRFYQHGGLDFQGIARAVFRLVEAKIQGKSRRVEGASTITQQVVKNVLLSNERSLERKIKEAILAIRIERAFSKDKILEFYLNEIYLGIGAYGVAAASLNYFNKELQDLTIEEVAYLAALPKAPNNYHPFRNTKAALARRNWIIGQMQENGYITAAKAEVAKKKPLGVNIRPLAPPNFAAEYFAEEVRRTLLNTYGKEMLYSGGLSVRTTLDPNLQQIARRALMGALAAFDRRKGWRGPVKKIDVSGDWGAVLAKINSPGDIRPWRLGVVLKADAKKAIVGLRPEKQQDGSLVDKCETVKLAFDEVKWAKSAKTVPKSVTDVLAVGDVIYVAPKDPKDLTSAWSLMQIPEVGGGIVALDPKTGRVRAGVGVFSFDMSQFDRAIQVKPQPRFSFKPSVYAAAIDNGYKPASIVLDAPIEIEQNLLPAVSMSLGAGETTLLRLMTAYCVFANGGHRLHATLIDRIQDRWGKTIWHHDQRICDQCKAQAWTGQDELQVLYDRIQIIDPHTAYQMTSILEGVIQRGTARSVRSLGRPIAGKTGKTNEEKNAWFIGYSPDLAVGVFVGYDTHKPMGKGQTGGRIAAPIFGDFMKEALADTPPPYGGS